MRRRILIPSGLSLLFVFIPQVVFASEGDLGDLFLLNRALAESTIRLAGQQAHPEVVTRVLEHIPKSQDGTYVVTEDAFRRKGLLLQLLMYPDVRVQFAAADVAMRLLPDKPIPGGYQLTATLVRMIATDAAPSALVIDGDPARAAESTAIFRQMGYRVLHISTGRAGFRMAARQAFDFIAIEPSIGNWSVRDTVANLKADQRTAGIPVFIYDTSRIWWNDTGVHQNATFCVQPDPISGMQCWHQKVTVGPAEAGDQYGDVVVDTAKSREAYLDWMSRTRPAPGPGGLRRPLWYARPLKPAAPMYHLED